MFSAQIRKRRVVSQKFSNWAWHIEEDFVAINGELHDLWRVVDHKGEVMEAYVTKRRDRMAALKFAQNDEAVWHSRCRRDQPAALLSGGDESHRDCLMPGDWPMAQQPDGKLAPALQPRRESDGQVSQL